ncbi:uncharacterized protein LOC106639437 [Copidosoma floridanum]|uniref:uncharacterized protein LOC106639437 n=1 Tax=Copidosoma floridanum TaxID=29053 RepID=UPI0006C97294|nr:uncharacterized protein LOC106639437 [Copidosoma floridanum]
MSETEAKPAAPPTHVTIQPPPILQVASRMLRSPSHESVTTDLSLFSVSSIASDAKSANRLASFKSYSDVHLSGRGPSPNPESRLQVQGNRPADIPEILWFEEETELIRSCGALSSALGLQKSFSTSDVSQLPSPEAMDGRATLRSAVSSHGLDLAHRNGFLLEQARLDHASRSCSTWVAVGDIPTTSQLPSPHGGTTRELHPPAQQPASLVMLNPPVVPFTAADLVRSVNKKVRQSYIRRRLLTTYRALERLSQSEFNLDRLEAAASAATQAGGGGLTLAVPSATVAALASSGVPAGAALLQPGRKPGRNDHALTVKDVERERGKQLSKYERNMMIFNWLHTLDDTQVAEAALAQ